MESSILPPKPPESSDSLSPFNGLTDITHKAQISNKYVQVPLHGKEETILLKVKNITDFFCIHKKLGQGGFAIVHLAKPLSSHPRFDLYNESYHINPTQSKNIALKVFPNNSLSKPILKGIIKEFVILRSLSHKNIVKAFEIYEDHFAYVMSMECLEGGELLDRIIQKRFYYENEARDLFHSLLDAVNHMHKHGIVHRDLKPENILLSSKNNNYGIKIVDFGLAENNVFDDSLCMNKFCGTLSYMAPEIILRQLYGKNVDLWSLGVILYILLGGFHPFNNQSTKDKEKLKKKIVNCEYGFLPKYFAHISFEAKDLISKLLEPNPSKRMNSSQAINHEWLQRPFNHLIPLENSLLQLKQFQITKVQTLVNAVIAINKLKKIFKSKKKASDIYKSVFIEANNPHEGLYYQNIHSMINDYSVYKHSEEIPCKGEKIESMDVEFSDSSPSESLIQNVAMQLEDFEVFGELGKGTHSFVNLAIDKISNTMVALKKINIKKYTSIGETDDRIKTEIQTLTKLRGHPNIIQLFSSFKLNNFYFLSLELIEGGELFDKIVEKSHYFEDDARDLFYILLHTIKHCHDLDIIHGDLKPENIMLKSKDNDKNIKLIDFGLSSHSDSSSLEGIRGTPSYMAPEIISGQKYGKSIDLWALGVILYILLGGYSPFYHPNRDLMFKNITNGNFDFHSDIWEESSDDAKNLICQLLEVDTEKRLSVNNAINHPWFRKNMKRDLLLAKTKKEIRNYQLKKKARKIFSAIVAVNRMQRLLQIKKAREADPNFAKS